jgi:hypothetical protein
MRARIAMIELRSAPLALLFQVKIWSAELRA